LTVKKLQEDLKHEKAKNKSGTLVNNTKMPAKTKPKKKLQANPTSTKLVSPQVKRTKFPAPLKEKASVKLEPKSAEPTLKGNNKGLLYNSLEIPEKRIAKIASGPVPSAVETKTLALSQHASVPSPKKLQHGPVPSPKKPIETKDSKVRPQEEPDGSPKEEAAGDK
jgi:hypothetical protein